MAPLDSSNTKGVEATTRASLGMLTELSSSNTSLAWSAAHSCHHYVVSFIMSREQISLMVSINPGPSVLCDTTNLPGNVSGACSTGSVGQLWAGPGHVVVYVDTSMVFTNRAHQCSQHGTPYRGTHPEGAPVRNAHATTSGTFHPLCRVLCTLRSLYLYSVGPVSVLRLARDTPGNLNCSPKQLYS
jgi:hypothetical protein